MLKQILEDMLRVYVMDFAGSWDKYLPVMKFAYNDTCQATIKMATYEVLYGRRFRSPIFSEEGGQTTTIGLELVQITNAAVQKIKARIQTTQSREKSYVDLRHKDMEL